MLAELLLVLATGRAAELVAMLPEQAPVYRGRGPGETARMRADLFTELAEIGPPPAAVPFIVGELAHGHRVDVLAAAARAAGAAGPDARAAIPHLQRIIDPSFHDDRVTLRGEVTTARAEATRALWRIQRPDRPAGAPATFVTPWLDKRARLGEPLAGIAFTAHDGRTRGDLTGKPLAVTFAYTRCDNPNKCPVTIAAMARLQRALRKASLGSATRLAVITLDPRHDDTTRLATMARLQGLDLGDDALMLRPSPEDLERLEQTLDVPVGHGAGQINNHGVTLYLFDNNGRYVRRYHSVVWDAAQVVADMKRLARE